MEARDREGVVSRLLSGSSIAGIGLRALGASVRDILKGLFRNLNDSFSQPLFDIGVLQFLRKAFMLSLYNLRNLHNT